MAYALYATAFRCLELCHKTVPIQSLCCAANNLFHGKMFGELKKHCILFGVLGKMCNFVADKQNIKRIYEQFQCSV